MGAIQWRTPYVERFYSSEGAWSCAESHPKRDESAGSRASGAAPPDGDRAASDRALEASLGLVSSAITRRSRPEAHTQEVYEAQVEMYRADTVVKTTWAKRGKVVATPKKRGKVRRFSARSRRRAVFKLRNVKVEWKSLVTLTYPGVYPTTRESKRHLDNFMRRVRRRWPGIAYVWVLEWQKRGAPHYHLLFDRSIPAQWLSEAWYKVVGSGDERHLRAGTKVEAPRSQGGITGYLAKYFGKLEQKIPPEDWPGRFWGCSRGLVESPTVAYFRGTFREVSRALRELRKAKAHYHRNRYRTRWQWRGSSFTVWGISLPTATALLGTPHKA